MSEVEKREKIIKIRVSALEHETLKHICPKAQLAEWMREFCLDPTGDWVNAAKVSTTGSIVDPDLLRALSGIGNNLNQVARRVNVGDWSSLQTLEIVGALRQIEEKLAAIRADHR